MDINYIARRIENTCEVMGGENNLIKNGLHNIMGYTTILNSINKMNSSSVANLLYNLHEMEGIYKDFALHTLKDGVLLEKFFTFDDSFEPAEDNLEKLFEDLVGSENIVNSIEDTLSESLKLNANVFKNYFNKNKNRMKPMSLNSKDRKQFQKSDFDFNKIFELKVKDFKKSFDKEIITWLEIKVPLLTDEEFGMMMAFIQKLRNG